MSLYAVQYTYSDDTAQVDAHRPEHREFLGRLAGEGVLVLSGPYVDEGSPGALLVLAADSAEAVRERLAEDPFQQRGLVVDARVREWNVIMGSRHRVLVG